MEKITKKVRNLLQLCKFSPSGYFWLAGANMDTGRHQPADVVIFLIIFLLLFEFFYFFIFLFFPLLSSPIANPATGERLRPASSTSPALARASLALAKSRSSSLGDSEVSPSLDELDLAQRQEGRLDLARPRYRRVRSNLAMARGEARPQPRLATAKSNQI